MVVLQAPSPTADDREGANSFSPSPSLLLLLSSLGAWAAVTPKKNLNYCFNKILLSNKCLFKDF
jgi:hypothetical protein